MATTAAKVRRHLDKQEDVTALLTSGVLSEHLTEEQNVVVVCRRRFIENQLSL